MVGAWLKVTFTSSVDAAHGALDIVQRKTYDVPVVPVKVEPGVVAAANDPPVPLMIVHEPVPTVGLFAARVTVVIPQVAELV